MYLFKKLYLYILVSCLVTSIIFTIKATSQSTEKSKEEAAFRTGIKAYTYGYPLVLMDITRELITNVKQPLNTGNAPVNQFGHLTTIPDPTFRGVVSPNLDTLYSSAFINLDKEPLILHVPDTDGRYYMMPVMDAWSNVVSSPGKRTTGTHTADFVITGPSWNGSLPKGMTEIKVPTSMGWIIGRIQWNGPEDTETVNRLQKQFTLTPLSRFGKLNTPPPSHPDPTIDMNVIPAEKINQLDANTFFKKLVQLMEKNPASSQDATLQKEMALIGINPGKPFDIHHLDPQVKKGLERAPKAAGLLISQSKSAVTTRVGPWNIDYKGGNYGTDYLRRAYTAMNIFGENKAEDALYGYASTDDNGDLLNGKNNYTLHFNKDELPPVNGFWSITPYNPQHFLVENKIQRYTLGDRSNLQPNPDGSVDIYLQSTSPGNSKESNWLPIPAGDFNLILRLYWPSESIVNRIWKLPAIKKL